MSLPIKGDNFEVVSGGAQNPSIKAGIADPSSGAGVAAFEGSLYLRYVAAAGQLYFKSSTGDIDWSLVGDSIVTLDDAYNGGRAITADAGAVTINLTSVTATHEALTLTESAVARTAPMISATRNAASTDAGAHVMSVVNAGGGVGVDVVQTGANLAARFDRPGGATTWPYRPAVRILNSTSATNIQEQYPPTLEFTANAWNVTSAQAEERTFSISGYAWPNTTAGPPGGLAQLGFYDATWSNYQGLFIYESGALGIEGGDYDADTGSKYIGPYLSFGSGNTTNLPVGTEKMMMRSWGTGSVHTWKTGALALQRFNQFLAPTIAFAGASTVTSAANLYVDKPSVIGSLATITNNYAAWFDEGIVAIDDQIEMVERADHVRDTLTGRGAIWLKNTTETSLIFTDSGGVDWTIGGGAAGTLDASYTLGQTIDADLGPVAISSVADDTNHLLTLNKSPTTPSFAGNALDITIGANSTGAAINVTTTSTSRPAIAVDAAGGSITTAIGSSSALALRIGQADHGFYRSGASQFSVRANSIGVFSFRNGGAGVGYISMASNGTTANAVIAHAVNKNTGLYFPTTSEVGFTTNGTQAVRWDVSQDQHNAGSIFVADAEKYGYTTNSGGAEGTATVIRFRNPSGTNTMEMQSTAGGAGVRFASGGVTNPSITWISDPQSGLHRVTSGFGFSVVQKRVAAFYQGTVVWTPFAQTSGSPVAYTLTGAAHTDLAANTEASDVAYDLSRTVEFTTGTGIALQRAFRIAAPEYAATAATETITKAVTLSISGAPTEGTNMNITTAYALDVESGNVHIAGDLIVDGAGGGGSLDASYTIGQTIDADLGPVAISSANLDTNHLLTLNKSPASGSYAGNALDITMGANATGAAIGITTTGVTKPAIAVNTAGGQILAASGAVGTPGYGFSGDADTGVLYDAASFNASLVYASQVELAWSSGRVTIANLLASLDNGTAGAPTLTSSNNTGSGLWYTGTADGVAISTDGTQAVEWTSTQNQINTGWISIDSGGASDPRMMAGTTDPSVGLAAPEGSTYQRFVTAAGELWLKTGTATTAWTQLTGSGSLDDAYNGGATIAVDAGQVLLSQSGTSNALAIGQTGAGYGLIIGLSTTATAKGILIEDTDATVFTSPSLRINRLATASATATLIDLNNPNDSVSLDIAQSGNAAGVNVNMSGSGAAIIVDLATNVDAKVFTASEDAVARTGPMFDITRDLAALGAGILVTAPGTGPNIVVNKSDIQEVVTHDERGFILENTEAATNGAGDNQFSPLLSFEGTGWDDSFFGSRDVKVAMGLQTATTASAEPAGVLNWHRYVESVESAGTWAATPLMSLTTFGQLDVNEFIQTTGNTGGFVTFTSAAHTDQDNTEINVIDFDISADLEFNGDVTTQRFVLVQAPTLSGKTSERTFVTAATFAIEDAPQIGTFSAITNPLALWVQAGLSRLDGGIIYQGQAGQDGMNTLSSGTNVATDCNLGNIHELTLGINVTMSAPSNPKIGHAYTWEIKNGGSVYTVTWNSVFKWPGGVAPTMTPSTNAFDIYTGIYTRAGTFQMGSPAQDIK